MQPENEKYQHFGGVSVKKKVLVNQKGPCSKGKTQVNVVLSKDIWSNKWFLRSGTEKQKGNRS